MSTLPITIDGDLTEFLARERHVHTFEESAVGSANHLVAEPVLSKLHHVPIGCFATPVEFCALHALGGIFDLDVDR